MKLFKKIIKSSSINNNNINHYQHFFTHQQIISTQHFISHQQCHFINNRNDMFNLIKNKINGIYFNTQKPSITIKLKDGKQFQGHAFQTTPLTIINTISSQLTQPPIAAKVKYTKKYPSPFGQNISSIETSQQKKYNSFNQLQLVDLNYPLQGDCEIQLITFNDKDGKDIFWHSSAHLLGQCLQNNWGAWLCYGPPLEHGFFYDSFMGNFKISQSDYQKIQNQIKNYISQNQTFQRIILTKKQALQMFAYNPFKKHLIQSKIPDQSLTSAYRCGNLVDLCTGPHIPSSNYIKGFKIIKNSSSYWLGKKQNNHLQRVYAISFPQQKLLSQYLTTQEQLSKRDHRNIGQKQDLFHFTAFSPGSALFYPHGTTIYTRLQQLIRQQYRLRGYQQVITPTIYNSQLWKISGHYYKYKQNIFWITNQNQQYGIKPMNCPGHCAMYNIQQHSYKDLPIRYADFGILHRNQLVGTLSGLTRVRKFQQDDSHIFCRHDQIQQQILNVLDFLDYIYSIFNFKYIIQLSTRPQQYLGTIQDWNQAQHQLILALQKFGKQYKINSKDGAFYGPKIDVKLLDIFKRQHQCGTIQLDFQLPQRFNLQYKIKQTNQSNKLNINKQNNIQSNINKNNNDTIQKNLNQKQKLKQHKKINKQHHQKSQNQIQKKNQHSSTNISDQQKYNKIQPLKNGFDRPVMIHRAIFGSLQRFIAILCQHNGGKWDFWLSPRQLKIIPINKNHIQYAQQIKNSLLLQGFSVEVDSTGDRLDKKIRNAQIQAFNYIGVVGQKQLQSKTITLRRRDENQPFGTLSIPNLQTLFHEQAKPQKSKKRQQIQRNSFKS